jgi:hypothetical protein
MLRLILNEKRQPLSAHANLQMPNRERTVLPVKEVVSTFPKLVLYFDGTSLDRCIATFYKKEAPATWVLQDDDCADEMLEIFADCGYILDPPEEDAPQRTALTDEEKRLHHEMISDIRSGLSQAFSKNMGGTDSS